MFDEKAKASDDYVKKNGEIRFENFNFNYFTDGPKVLTSMTFTVKPGEKIGIGRLI